MSTLQWWPCTLGRFLLSPTSVSDVPKSFSPNSCIFTNYETCFWHVVSSDPSKSDATLGRNRQSIWKHNSTYVSNVATLMERTRKAIQNIVLWNISFLVPCQSMLGSSHIIRRSILSPNGIWLTRNSRRGCSEGRDGYWVCYYGFLRGHPSWRSCNEKKVARKAGQGRQGQIEAEHTDGKQCPGKE